MYYYSKKSKNKIIHTQSCFHIRNTDLEEIGWFETLSEAFAQGYRLCRHCSPIARQFRKESSEIYDYCGKNGLAVHLNSSTVRVTTPRSTWKIAAGTDGQIVLYHHNTFRTAQDRFSEFRGYHLQRDVSADTMIAYLKYIVEHDYFRMVNPIYGQLRKGELPPKKGTKRYKREQRRMKEQERRRAIRNVLTLIESLHAPETAQQTAV